MSPLPVKVLYALQSFGVLQSDNFYKKSKTKKKRLALLHLLTYCRIVNETDKFFTQ
jgi:hypothetical protein